MLLSIFSRWVETQLRPPNECFWVKICFYKGHKCHFRWGLRPSTPQVCLAAKGLSNGSLFSSHLVRNSSREGRICRGPLNMCHITYHEHINQSVRCLRHRETSFWYSPTKEKYPDWNMLSRTSKPDLSVRGDITSMNPWTWFTIHVQRYSTQTRPS